MPLMQLEDSDLDSFCTWLCQREHEIVGRPGMVYHCPLAQWLSECAGHIYGVDSGVYGQATCAYHCWRLLPRWAEVFVAWSDVLAFRPITGGEALVLLASVELALRVMSA